MPTERKIALVILAVFVVSCGCDENGTAPEDTASATGDIDGTTESGETDSVETEGTDSSTDMSTDWQDFEWQWSEIPESEVCGEGCRQLVFGNDIGEGDWDVWGDRVMIGEHWGTGLKIIDLKKNKTARVPNPYPTMSDGDINKDISYDSPSLNTESAFFCLSYHPVENRAIYREQFFKADIKTGKMEKILDYDFAENDKIAKEKHGETYPSIFPGQIDVSDKYLISVGGCEPYDLPTLCVFDLTSGDYTPRTAISGTFGVETMLWDETAVFRDLRYHPADETITGVNLKTLEEFRMTEALKSQIYPRLYEDKLVYMDFRHGDDDPYGDWHNSAVYLMDVNTRETKLVAGKDHIAVFPDINGEIVVWQDYRDCENPNDIQEFHNSEVWGYNIKTGKEFKITNLPNRKKLFPRVWGGRAFIQMSRKDDPTKTSIYAFDISEHTK